MRRNFYVPVLKGKQGEFDGLSKINDSIREYVVPLLEVTPLEFDNATKQKPKTIEEHLDGFCKKFGIKWKGLPAFLDVALVENELAAGKNPLAYILKRLDHIGNNIICVLNLHSPTTIVATAANQLSLGLQEKIAIRVTVEDISSAELKEQVDEFLKTVSLAPEDCHLIIDLHASDFSNLDDFSDSIAEILSSFPYYKKWHSFTLAGGAFPATQLIKQGDNMIPRNDWKFYQAVRKKLSESNNLRIINFADYSIVSPGYFEFDPRKMSRSANIRYTLDNSWLVIKGTALKKSLDFKQYKDQASKITKSKYFFGESFSDGDSHLIKCSRGTVPTGNPTVWKRVGHNHHITKVVKDLFAS